MTNKTQLIKTYEEYRDKIMAYYLALGILNYFINGIL